MVQNMLENNCKKALENHYGKVSLLVHEICLIQLTTEKSLIYVGKN